MNDAQSMRNQVLPGVEPHSIGYKWRTDPPPYVNTPEWHRECMDAVIDSLTAEGVIAWPGDGTSCVCQIITLLAARLAAATAGEKQT